MGDSSLPDDADFIAASAVAALAIAVSAGTRIKGDPTLSEWVREVGELPSWRDDAHGWAVALHRIQRKYAHPSDTELADRTTEQSLFNRVRSSALDVLSSRDPRARQFHLGMASIAAGSLLAFAYGSESSAAIEAAFATAYVESGRQGGVIANASRNGLKDKASAHLSRFFQRFRCTKKARQKASPTCRRLPKS
ncbi:hypothetical protein LJB71_07160 [Thermomonas sp. S9]|uniref:hypothetical protein n=1 Tax=Thermomonas sp. S9 TaxID=2885203 RepID=UPI00216AD1E1|nr:hypothetical protein [Thermomonas sp. S9]MCR6496019.1 hypothetical protein [Thermomonas sp. S9]